MELLTLENTVPTTELLDMSGFNIDRETKLNLYGYIYKITNKENGKIYIGKTKDINRRAREYITSNKDRAKLKGFSKIICELGYDKFKMEPIDIAMNKDELSYKELDYILKFDAMNPEVGYNTSLQSVQTPDNVHQKVRMQKPSELMKRSKIICAMDVNSKYILFSTGLKLFGDIIGRSKDEIKSAARRCSTMNGFTLFYLNPDDYAKQEYFLFNHQRKEFRGLSITPKEFIERHDYVINYLNTGENPDGYTIKFVYQSDSPSGYSYDIDVTPLREYYNSIINNNSLHKNE